LAVFIACAGLASQTPTEKPATAEFARKREIARKELLKFLPKLELLEDRYANDAEVQLGLGVLYARYATSEQIAEKAEEQWQRVLTLDPNHRPAWATVAIRDTYVQTARRRNLLDRLERRIQNAEQRGVREFTIHRQTSLMQTSIRKDGTGGPELRKKHKPNLHQYLSKGDDKVLVIDDFNGARKQLKGKLDKEVSGPFDTISQGQQHDPGNALYDYLRAYPCLELGNKEAALGAIKQASKKKYLNTYFTETREAVARVLEIARFPQDLRSYITDVYTPFGDFIRGKLWRKGLEPVSRKYQEQQKVTHALEMFEMTRRMAKHISEEPLPYASPYNTALAQSMKGWADKKSKEISGKNKQLE